MQDGYVSGTQHENAIQRALLQYNNPGNYNLVYEALVSAGREDLIGSSSKCMHGDFLSKFVLVFLHRLVAAKPETL